MSRGSKPAEVQAPEERKNYCMIHRDIGRPSGARHARNAGPMAHAMSYFLMALRA
jgi:hypothetical protein